MQAERCSLCRLPHHIKLIILKLLSWRAISLLEDHLHQISAPNSFTWVLNSTKNLLIGKSDILTLNWGLFLDSKLFLKITIFYRKSA